MPAYYTTPHLTQIRFLFFIFENSIDRTRNLNILGPLCPQIYQHDVPPKVTGRAYKKIGEVVRARAWRKHVPGGKQY